MNSDALNIEENRDALKYPLRVQFMRIAWALGNFLFMLIPRPFYGPRRVILRLFGARIGQHVNISNTATIYFPWNLEVGDWAAIGEHALIYNLGTVTIGEKTTISQRAHICAGSHDYSEPTLRLLTPPVHVGNQVWICADAFIGPGVTVADGAVVGARAVAIKDVEAWTVVAGNPARPVTQRVMKGRS